MKSHWQEGNGVHQYMPPADAFGFLVLSFVKELRDLQTLPDRAELRCCLTTNESSGIES